MSKTMWWMVPAALVVGCDDSGGGLVALTQGQLSERLAGGTQRLEVKLRADGSVREVQVEFEGPGHAEELAGKLLALDVEAGQMEIEHLGTVDFTAAGRFRTEDESRVDRASWLAAAENALARGANVWVEARGRFGAGFFAAHEVRWEDDAEREIEADVAIDAFDEATGRLTIGHLTFDLGGVPIRAEDDDWDDDDDDWDDDDDDRDDDDDDDDDWDDDDDDRRSR